MKPWAEGFYKSLTWIRCRNSFLKSKGYLCERCLARGEFTPAKIVHHKIYLTQDNINNPAVTLEWGNLEALCQDCHNKEHHAEKKNIRYLVDESGKICDPDGAPPIRGWRAHHRDRRG